MAKVLRFPSPQTIAGRRYMAMYTRADDIVRTELLRTFAEHGNDAAKDLAEWLIRSSIEWAVKVIGADEAKNVIFRGMRTLFEG